MKMSILFTLLFWAGFQSFAQPRAENVIIITLDGCRWQEIFNGADSSLLFDSKFRKTEAGRLTRRYWSVEADERRAKLMPFLWNTVSKDGRIYGNRNFDNKVSVRNSVNVSFPGYSEIFTGYADPEIINNEMQFIKNTNLFSFLNQQPGFEGKVAAFASWDRVMGYMNSRDNKFVINGGYSDLNLDGLNELQHTLNNLQKLYHNYESSRPDYITYLQAKEYLNIYRPRALSIGFAWTDDMAHDGSYPLYLDKIFIIDNMIQDLWEFVQSLSQYKDKTALLITVDHGRGNGDRWTSHGKSVPGSEQTWFALISPGLSPQGEMKTPVQLYQDQLAQTVANILGFEFAAEHPVAPAISLDE